MQHILSRITKERLPELRAALNRALNTWEDAPKWLVELCDCLDASSDSAVRYGANYDLHPYQQRLIDLINNTPYAKPVRVSPVMIDEIPEFEDQLPFWAEMAVPAGHDGYGYVRAQLCTRDGRVMGNAVIESLEHGPEGKTLYTVLTDMGNRIRMNYAEMVDQFHAPKWVMKEDAIGKRLDKMTPAAPSQPAVPQGYALISVDALQAWGKLDEVKAACVYPTTADAPSQEPAHCTNSDTWNCKYCRKTESCEALNDPRNFAAPSQPGPLTDELDMLDVKVSAGLCQVTAYGKHAYLREIQAIIAALREKEKAK